MKGVGLPLFITLSSWSKISQYCRGNFCSRQKMDLDLRTHAGSAYACSGRRERTTPTARPSGAHFTTARRFHPAPPSYTMAPMTGEEVIAQSLKNQGIEYMFGVVGIPVQGIAAAVRASLSLCCTQPPARSVPRFARRAPRPGPNAHAHARPRAGASGRHRLLRLPQRAGRVVRLGLRRLPHGSPGRCALAHLHRRSALL